jgi:SAM-dependent methyltransferase
MERDYILGTHDAELERLGLQHRVWSEQAFALWERAGFRPGQAVLDVGCGPGYATIDMARLLGPTTRVLAIDESQRFLSFLNAQKQAQALDTIETRAGDVQHLDACGVGPESIDVAYCRWVLCWVKDPAAVVAGVARALRPGGVFAVQDYFNYLSLTLAPRSEVFTKIVQGVGASQRASGGDPDLVGRLPRMFADNGLMVREIRPILRVARPGDLLWQWPTTFFRNYVPRMVAAGFLTEADRVAFDEDWERRTHDPASFFVTPPVFDVIGVKSK